MVMKKIILINPPLIASRQDEHVSPPLGLAYLAAVLCQNDYQVSIIDMSIGARRKSSDGYYYIGKSWDETGVILAKEKPDIVGVGCPFSSRLPFAIRTVNLVKEILPKAKVIMGGLHPTIAPNETLEKSGADYIVIGEGEKVLIRLLAAIQSGEDVSSIDAVGGYYKGKRFINPQLDLPEPLDDIPHPARDLLDMDSYIGQPMALWSARKNRQTSVITSRGCPMKCTFCSAHRQSGHKWRGRSTENVLEELQLLKDRYRIESIAFFDDNFALNRKRLREICQGMIDRKMNLVWSTPNGITVKTLDLETLKLMRESGCEMLNLAIESGDEYILNSVINKNQSIDQVREVAENCHDLGIVTNGYFVIGMPGETENSIIKSIEFAKSLPLRDVGVFIATPFPGTQLFEDGIKEGYLDKNEMENMFDGSPDNAIFHKSFINTPVMSAERLEFWEKEFHRQFWDHKVKQNPMLKWRLRAGKIVRKFLK